MMDDEIDRIMAMSDEELLAEVRANGEDPEKVAQDMRALFERTLKVCENREALATMVYEALRFASWAAGEGISPAPGEPAKDPAIILCDYCQTAEIDDWENVPDAIRSTLLGRN